MNVEPSSARSPGVDNDVDNLREPSERRTDEGVWLDVYPARPCVHRLGRLAPVEVNVPTKVC